MPETAYSEPNNSYSYMKRLFFQAILSLCLCVFALSCNKDPYTLDETEWSIERFEDVFSGEVMKSGDLQEASLTAFKDADDVIMYLNVTEFNWVNSLFEPKDYSIVKYTNDELVLDLLYYEYSDLKRTDCNYLETFKGKRIYSATTSIYEGAYTYYVYFKSGDKAVDVGRAEDQDSELGYYFYDTTRVYCKRMTN